MMGLLSKIFGSKKDVSNVDIDNKAKSSVKNVPRNENCIKLMIRCWGHPTSLCSAMNGCGTKAGVLAFSTQGGLP